MCGSVPIRNALQFWNNPRIFALSLECLEYYSDLAAECIEFDHHNFGSLELYPHDHNLVTLEYQ